MKQWSPKGTFKSQSLERLNVTLVAKGSPQMELLGSLDETILNPDPVMGAFREERDRGRGMGHEGGGSHRRDLRRPAIPRARGQN